MNFNVVQTPAVQAVYLRTLPAIRERCGRVFDLATQGKLQYFDYHRDKEAEVTEFCVGIIQRDFGSNYASIPPHGRWRHFNVDTPRLDHLVASWRAENVSNDEICKRVIDLCLVSVLLDAGAGPAWVYAEPTSGKSYGRSEGLAIASLDMFRNGLFSADVANPFRVDASALKNLTPEAVGIHLQVNPTSNPMDGLEGRAQLLSRLGIALAANEEFFGSEGRPGNMIDFLRKESKPVSGKPHVADIHIFHLWAVVMDGLSAIWPASRTQLAGVSLGDVWPCEVLHVAGSSDPAAHLVPFHKLSQWLAYSLVEPLETILKWHVDGVAENMTGLPEYRNGGLYVDHGVLTLRTGALPDSAFVPGSSGAPRLPRLPPAHPAIIEWRALTVILLDRTASAIRARLAAAGDAVARATGPTLTLPQILESATWKGGREIARLRRGAGGGPPIEIISDGTVF